MDKKKDEKDLVDTLIEAGLPPRIAEHIRTDANVARKASQLLRMSLRSLDDQAPIEDAPKPSPPPAPSKEGSGGGIRRPKPVPPVASNDVEHVGIHKLADLGIQQPPSSEAQGTQDATAMLSDADLGIDSDATASFSVDDVAAIRRRAEAKANKNPQAKTRPEPKKR